MSIFNELLPKLTEISNAYTKNFQDDLKAALEAIEKFEEEYQNGRRKAREKVLKEKHNMTTLQSIDEDDDVNPTSETGRRSNDSNNDATQSSTDSNASRRKRSKNEVDDMSSPEQDKRQKRNASVKAQNIISKQVNMNLMQKLRREDSADAPRRRRDKGEDKENQPAPTPTVYIKQEKISLPVESMEEESVPSDIPIKQEVNKDDFAMPPPIAPGPRTRNAFKKEASKEKTEDNEEESSRRRTTRSRKQTDTAYGAASSRSTRASSRAARPEEERPKRTRGKKKASEMPAPDDKETTRIVQDSNTVASPAEKPRPKRTRRGQKAAEKIQEPEKNDTTQPVVQETTKSQRAESPILEKAPSSKEQSPILPIKDKKKEKKPPIDKNVEMPKKNLEMEMKDCNVHIESCDEIDKVQKNEQLEETRTISNDETANDMDKTVVLPNGGYNAQRNMNETVVIETCNRATMVLDKPQNVLMDATVIIEKAPMQTNITEDNSLLTDDSDVAEPRTPTQPPPLLEPTSAVKEKVQQFEELATRATRTKTRAMAKKEEKPEENHTPPDKISKPILSAETLNKMNSLIFNGKHTQVSSSATKPRAIPVLSAKVTASASKISAREEDRRREMEKEDARKKKEALLEAKRELQRRKREEKMAAAAAAREAAERERRAAQESAARGREERQAHLDLGKVERLKEVERKKQELARKVAETEERRRADEALRQHRVAEELRRAADRRKQLEEAEAVKKEAAIMAKEIEKKQKEYIEKQKMKQRLEDKLHSGLSAMDTPGRGRVEPVYMQDGFQFLNSDEDENPEERSPPEWSSSKARRARLLIQAAVAARHVDRLFSVRVHSPDLREIFPNIERRLLKRTSSAVWRTPPHRAH